MLLDSIRHDIDDNVYFQFLAMLLLIAAFQHRFVALVGRHWECECSIKVLKADIEEQTGRSGATDTHSQSDSELAAMVDSPLRQCMQGNADRVTGNMRGISTIFRQWLRSKD